MIKKLFFAAVLLVCAQVAMAENVLYAQVEGTNMTLKYGEKPGDSETTKYHKYDGSQGWNGTFMGNIQTATVDASCSSYDGTTLESLFSGFENLTAISGIDNLNTDNVTTMRLMFNQCSSLTTLDLHTFNTAKVTDMAMMFDQCSSLTSLRVAIWNTANVTNMLHMFQDCSSLTTLNLSEWNTAKVTYMTSMFQGCSNLVTIFVSTEWNTNAVDYSDNMFLQCEKIKGSDGTIYDPSKLDKTYARIGGGGENNKGYMSGLKTNLAEGRRWATWYSNDTYVIDAEEDADAYTAEYDSEHSCLILHKLGKVIPKENAVIIVADKDNKNIIVTIDNEASVADMPVNNLKGYNVNLSVDYILEDLYHENSAWGRLYVMGMVNNNFGFYEYIGSHHMPANKAFLPIRHETLSGANAISLVFSEEVTGIKEVHVDEGQAARNKVQGDDVWYTINGMRLNGKPSAPGLYINNGKKVSIN